MFPVRCSARVPPALLIPGTSFQSCRSSGYAATSRPRVRRSRSRMEAPKRRSMGVVRFGWEKITGLESVFQLDLLQLAVGYAVPEPSEHRFEELYPEQGCDCYKGEDDGCEQVSE